MSLLLLSMLPYALAIFSSAFLLFQVQPLIGKYILPWFGGGPGVWTTCLLFFQLVLLAGYAYAHWVTRLLKPRHQALVHGALLVAAAVLLPIAPREFWKSHIAGDPTWHILLLLGGTIGLPYFVLSSTGPLLQQWFSVTRPGRSPYRLYALSNFGSLLALLSYPTYFEVKFSRYTQAALWSAGFIVFAILCAYCAWQLRRAAASNRDEPLRAATSRSGPLQTASNRDEPDQAATNRSEPLRTASNRDEPDQAASNRDEPLRTAAGRSEPGQTASNRDEPDQAASNRDELERTAAREPGYGGAAHEGEAGGPTRLDKMLWVALPAVASVLLLATTNKLCQEIAVIPFLWVLPLSLYLLSFVICFDHARWYARGLFAALLTTGMAVSFQLMPAGTAAPLGLQIACYTATLFFACMVCHGELYQLKPAPRHLTAFYLAISAGGALGGVLVAVVAPAVFTDFRELPLGYWILSYLVGVVAFRQMSRGLAFGAAVGLMLVTFVVPIVRSHFSDGLTIGDEWLLLYRHYGWFILGGLLIFIGCAMDSRTRKLVTSWQPRLGGFLMALSVVVGILVIVQWRRSMGADVVDATRNFYGTLKVYDYDPQDPESHYYLLLHGATTHGLQFTADDKAMRHTTYYAESSGIGLAIKHLPQPAGSRRIGLVGLGTGTLASYGTPGDTLRIYDINPAVVRLARSRFTYLRRCPAKTEVILGDARLSMEHELAENQRQRFDLLALDAFSSDAIPVHLLTKEAFAIYLQHLKPDGVLAVHTSNRYLNLRPVVERLAAEYGLTAATISDDEERDWWVYRTTWILVTKNQAILDQPEIKDIAELAERPARYQPLWTDDYASVFQVMR